MRAITGHTGEARSIWLVGVPLEAFSRHRQRISHRVHSASWLVHSGADAWVRMWSIAVDEQVRVVRLAQDLPIGRRGARW